MRTTNCINNAIVLEKNGQWQKSDRVKTEIVPFILQRASKGRRNAPKIPAGTTLYAIKYELGGYFTYSYVKREHAELAIQNSRDQQTNTFQFYGFNVVDDANDTLPVSS